jgi:hypothetical protein
MKYGIAKKRKMSQEIDLCEDSDDNGERPNTAFVFRSLPLSRKRPRDHPRNETSPADRNTTGSTAFGVDLKLADEMEISVSRHKRRRGVMRGERRAKKDAAGECSQIRKGVPGIERRGSEDSEQTSRDNGSAHKHSQELSTLKQPSKASERQGRYSTWEDRLSELADYRKFHGHCNVPRNCSERSKLARWVTTQRTQYNLHIEGKKSSMTLSRIQELERMGFEWGVCVTAWEDRLSELADYRKFHGHCNVYSSENLKLCNWVATQRKQYNLHVKGRKTSFMTLSRIQELESLGFEWDSHRAAWDDCLGELADYRKINGHCNVPQRYSENLKLATWVKTQRKQYKLHLEGEKSHITLSRIQALETLGFEWFTRSTSWEDRLSELADYRKIYGHCNVPKSYSENTKLANWVATQRSNYRLQLEGETSYMTLARIQELESLGFEWVRCSTAWEVRLSELADYRKIHGHCNVPNRYSENTALGKWVRTQRYQYRLHIEGKCSYMTLSHIQELESLGFHWKPSSASGRRRDACSREGLECSRACANNSTAS